MVDEQTIDSLEEVCNLNDSEVSNLCKALRKPGGTIQGPNNALIPDPGVRVSLIAENNLKLACYYLRHLQRISRTVTINQVTLDRVRALKELKEAEEAHQDPNESPKVDMSNMTNTMETIFECLHGFQGITKIPLAYLVRPDPDLLPEAADPPENYSGPEEEMIYRAPHHSMVGGQ